LAEVSARNRLYEQAADFAARAIELDQQSWRGYALLGINQLRNGVMTEGRANLEKAFAGDPYDVWTKNTLDLLDALEQYVVVPSERFEFVIDGKESDLLALYFSGLGDEAYRRMHERYGHRPETPIRVEVFPSHTDFSVRTIGLVGLGALGVSFGPVVAMDSPSARERGEFNWGSTLWHELAHTFHMSMSDHRVPRWFTEGLAVLEERHAKPGWGIGVSPGFLAAYSQERLLPVSQLNDGFLRPSYPEQLGFSYYQASLVCELIEQEHGSDALVRMLHGYGEGRSTAELFATVLGVDLERFDEMFDQYLADRFAGPLRAISVAEREGASPHASRDEVAQRARTDPGDFLAQLAMGQILAEEGRGNEAIPYLERAKALFPEYAEADSPYWYLAQVYQEKGELERAESELASLMMHNERHYPAYTKLAEVREMLRDPAGAAAALEGALFVYPMEAGVHLRLAELYTGLERWQEAIRERRAVLALDPVDRAEALYQLAKAYFDSGDMSEARRAVLQALERAPNFEQAQMLLLEIHSRNEETQR
jgi:tetratricopeptide (TPR) repeat protein